MQVSRVSKMGRKAYRERQGKAQHGLSLGCCPPGPNLGGVQEGRGETKDPFPLPVLSHLPPCSVPSPETTQHTLPKLEAQAPQPHGSSGLSLFFPFLPSCS